jgi:hypothetical protein
MNMSVQSDIQSIRDALNNAEADPSRRNVRNLHNLLAELMVRHKDLLGLSDDDVTTFGGGRPKDPEG